MREGSRNEKILDPSLIRTEVRSYRRSNRRWRRWSVVSYQGSPQFPNSMPIRSQPPYSHPTLTAKMCYKFSTRYEQKLLGFKTKDVIIEEVSAHGQTQRITIVITEI